MQNIPQNNLESENSQDNTNTSPVIATRRWLESVVIDLNLCPFAKAELIKNTIRFKYSPAQSTEALLTALASELNQLETDKSIETTLLIHPQVLQNFSDFNQFLDLADQLLRELNLEGVFQIASFHPDYQFGGTNPDDVENYSNRSPYPTLHLIREASLERAIAAHPNVDGIPERNIDLLNQLGLAHMQALLAACCRG